MTVYGVTGATGQLGVLVVNALAANHQPGDKVVALARSVEKAKKLFAAQLESKDIEVRTFDYEGKELQGTLSGIDVLLLISASDIGSRLRQHQAVIEAAKAARVKHLVYTSLLHADAMGMVGTEHVGTEVAIKSSEIPFTILRNSWYFENETSRVGAGLATGVITGASASGRFSSASRADYAEAAVNVMTTFTEHVGASYELGGDASFSLEELAAEVSKQSAKKVTFQNVPEADYAKILESIGLPGFVAEFLAAADAHASKGHLEDDSKTLSRLIQRPTSTLSDFVKRVLPTAQ